MLYPTHFNVDPDIPFEKLNNDFKEILLHGSGEINIEYYMRRKISFEAFPWCFQVTSKKIRR